MWFSIQEYLKKINSRLTFVDILSLFTTLMFILTLLFYIQYQEYKNRKDVIYHVAVGDVIGVSDGNTTHGVTDARPFGSMKGKTYTFSWCQGSSRISSKNKIYFANEEEAKGRGRALSKMCKK